MNFDYESYKIFPVPIHAVNVNDFKEYQSKLIDYAWVKVFEHLEILGFISRNATEINA